MHFMLPLKMAFIAVLARFVFVGTGNPQMVQLGAKFEPNIV